MLVVSRDREAESRNISELRKFWEKMAKKSCQNNVTVENQDFDLSVDNVLPDMLCITLSNSNCCYKGALLKCNKE